MARIVTRVTSKNFCIVKPSFTFENATDYEGRPMLKVNSGQACINGMDLIIDQSIRIYPPDDAGEYYLALHLWRDSSDNVLGDLTVGVSKQFKGVYLDWWTSKYEGDKDALWLGKVIWNGNQFTSMEEDLDKYGRIWAEDILCKVEDWKHPDTTRILLQDWLYKVPDWYVSKEGDVMFGPLELLAGRDSDVEGTSDNHQDIGSGKHGIRLEVPDENTVVINIKAPSVSQEEVNRNIKIKESITGTDIDIGPTKIKCNTATSYDFTVTTPNNLKLNGTKGILLYARDYATGCRLQIDDTSVTMSKPDCTVGEFKTIFSENNITQKLGAGIITTTNGVDKTETISGNSTVTVNKGKGNITYNAREFHVEGDITAQRVWNAVYNGFGEIFRKDRYENIEYGDLVCVRADGLVHKVATAEDIEHIVGICSDTVGIGLGGNNIPEDECIEVEMVGQVWVKTNDFLEAGKMVKALPDGTVTITSDRNEKIGVTLTETIDNKVRIVYNG